MDGRQWRQHLTTISTLLLISAGWETSRKKKNLNFGPSSLLFVGNSRDPVLEPPSSWGPQGNTSSLGLSSVPSQPVRCVPSIGPARGPWGLRKASPYSVFLHLVFSTDTCSSRIPQRHPKSPDLLTWPSPCSLPCAPGNGARMRTGSLWAYHFICRKDGVKRIVLFCGGHTQ